MTAKNAFYAQSGGVTAVINATACGVIETAKLYPGKIAKVLAGKNGIMAALHEELIDTSLESTSNISALLHTPGGAFGSCRYKLKDFSSSRLEYNRIIEVFKAHNIGYFFYNGGGDSQDTAYKISQVSQELDFPITCIGIPKTIDNDLPFTDTCPGFGSVAKYVALSILEASLDVASMASSSTQVFILEVMGRHAGWIAAAAGLAQKQAGDPPQIILFPEITFNQTAFCEQVKTSVAKYGFCSIVISEGVRDHTGKFLADAGLKDAFGHSQLGGVAAIIANIVKQNLNFKYHYAIADYLQRSARHIASATDVEQAYALGKAAIEFAIQGKNAIMPIIERKSSVPYIWQIGHVALSDVANVEKSMPKNFITADGFGITQQCREYLLPLIQGEAYPPYANGLPKYVKLAKSILTPILPPYIHD